MATEKKQGLLLTVTGPTASGKTALAVDIAQMLKTEILSCDSRQIYKEMSIGTAVPEPEYLELVKHHFIQNVSVTDPLNANAFGLSVREKLTELFATHKTVVMVGGSGLYIDSVLKGIDDIPSPSKEIRAEIQKRIDNGELGELQIELQKHDPEYFGNIDIQNPRRILRGLEVFYTTGQPLSTFLGKETSRPFSSAMIVLELEREMLYNKINQRVDLMIKQGLIEEVQSLYPHKTLSSLQTVGYQELFEHFDGKISLADAVEKIKSNTRQYARKQETWFRRYDGAYRISALEKGGISKLVKEIAC